MMTEDKCLCPNCGAEQVGRSGELYDWLCGSSGWRLALRHESKECLRRQLRSARAEAERRKAQNDKLFVAVQQAYRKHWLNDPEIGWEQLGDTMLTALTDAMGTDGCFAWVASVSLAESGQSLDKSGDVKIPFPPGWIIMRYRRALEDILDVEYHNKHDAVECRRIANDALSAAPVDIGGELKRKCSRMGRQDAHEAKMAARKKKEK